MKKVLIPLLMLLLWVAIQPAAAAPVQQGMTVTCGDGTSFNNGVPVTVVQMRTGFSYTATAIGLNGFDPVLAVLDENGRGLCSDDNTDASGFSVNLPTTGRVDPSLRTAQVDFSNNSGQPFADITLVVGGYGDASGEFVLVLDGMALTEGDGAGDPFSIEITPSMIESGVPVSAYMISVVQGFDPLMALVDGNLDFIVDDSGNFVACDDGGNTATCWGESSNLSRSSVSRPDGRTLGGGEFDAMLSIPLAEGMEGSFLNYLMRSYEMRSLGNYVIAFHIGVGEGASSGGNGGGITAAPTPSGRTTPPNTGGTSSGGMSISCTDGTSFDNGVPVTVIQMRAGFSYTATAVGLNGFDPVLAVLDENGRGLCNDDNPDARNFGASLPSTGQVSGASTSAQVEFANNTGQDFANITLVVGGYGNSTGEFLLVLEGMALTAGDGAGDPFSVEITSDMVNSGVPLTAYMVSVVDGFDPLMAIIDGEYNFLFDDTGAQIACDDAGNGNICWGDSSSLERSFISRVDGRRLSGGPYDAMLSIPMESGLEGAFVNFLMRSYEMSSLGNYLIAFHIGIGG